MTVILIFLQNIFKDILINKSRSVLRWVRAYDVERIFDGGTSPDCAEFGRRFHASESDISRLIVGEW